MTDNRIRLLQQMPIFGGIRDDAVVFLLERSPVVSMREGEFFFREGDEARALFVLENGRAAILKLWKGEQRLLRYLETGDCFGEMALMDMGARSASVVATADSTAIELSSGHLFELYERDLEQFTLIQMNMGREVSRRLRETDDRLFDTLMEQAAADVGQLVRFI